MKKEKQEKEKNKLSKKQKIAVMIVVSFVIIVISAVLIFALGKKDKENKPDLPLDNSSIILKDELSFEINSDVLISALLDEKNTAEIKNNDEKIDTSILGEKEITIKYLEDEKELEKNIKIMIVDTIAPVIESENELITTLNKEIDLLANIKVTDNSKEEIKATIEGTYDFKKEGSYNLKYIAIDSSNNKAEKEFVLKVTKDKNTSSSTNKKPTTGKKPSNNTTKKNPANNNSNTSSDDHYITEAEFKNQSLNFNLKNFGEEVWVLFDTNAIKQFVEYETTTASDLEVTISGPGKNETKITDTSLGVNGHINFRGLKINQKYTVTLKPYQEKPNGTKVYAKTTSKSFTTSLTPEYSSKQKAYIEKLYKIINDNREKKFIRDPNLEKTAVLDMFSSSRNLADECYDTLKTGDKLIAYRQIIGRGLTFNSPEEFYNYFKDKENLTKSGYTRIGIAKWWDGTVYVLIGTLCSDRDYCQN